MILEHAVLYVRPGSADDFLTAFAAAEPIMAAQRGVRTLRLSRSIERPEVFLLLVEWDRIEDHTEGFRGSPDYGRWRELLHHFYDPFPFVEHFEHTTFGFDRGHGDIGRMVPDGIVTPHDVAEATNRYRASMGFTPLIENPRLQTVAQTWTLQMADHNALAHNPWGAEQIPPGWTSTAENILQSWRTANADDLLAQWAGSPGHRDNILNPSYTDLGVGVAVATDGKLYATQVLARY